MMNDESVGEESLLEHILVVIEQEADRHWLTDSFLHSVWLT